MADYPYRLDGELVMVDVRVESKTNAYNGVFVFDTGASGIIIDHEIANDLGYSARDSIGLSTVSSAVGKERGYKLIVEGFEALGQKMASVEVRCHDLKDQGADGLIGMSFLKQFDWCVHPYKQIISVK